MQTNLIKKVRDAQSYDRHEESGGGYADREHAETF